MRLWLTAACPRPTHHRCGLRARSTQHTWAGRMRRAHGSRSVAYAWWRTLSHPTVPCLSLSPGVWRLACQGC